METIKKFALYGAGALAVIAIANRFAPDLLATIIGTDKLKPAPKPAV